ncbi:cytochrome c oxidase subunit 6A2, mitochondrial-like [Ornithodoros turicata]|uniref:cytochrome c oxidase subunit 6A2, mitochondrial-like n=1 Tax=Ornithodoros turicata TaxID=34597 RepID=UPI003139A860
MATFRVLPRFMRQFSNTSIRFSKAGDAESHHKAAQKLWKQLTFFVAIPACALCAVNAYLDEKEHHAHYHRPEYVPYDYLCVRTKKFPWGDGNHGLFHNPKVNAIPGGYEE